MKKLGGRTQLGALNQRLLAWMPETPNSYFSNEQMIK